MFLVASELKIELLVVNVKTKFFQNTENIKDYQYKFSSIAITQRSGSKYPKQCLADGYSTLTVLFTQPCENRSVCVIMFDFCVKQFFFDVLQLGVLR